MNMNMNILYQFNEKYAPYAGVSMTSLFENNKQAESIVVYVLGEELSDSSVDRLNALSKKYGRQILFIDTKALVEKMKALNMPTYRGSYAANMRLFVDYLFEEADNAGRKSHPSRLLYLDADTVVTGSLEKLFNTDADNSEAGALQSESGFEIKTLGMVYDTLSNFHKYAIGLTGDEGYYNSGVILIDVDKWIDKQYTEKIVDHVKNVRAQYPSPDQDLINVVVRDEISPLPVEYNFQPHLRDYSYKTFVNRFKPYPFYSESEAKAANAKPVILHAFRYLGEFPWHKGNCHPFNGEFDKYLALSTFNDYVKEDSGAGFVMKAEQLLYKILPKGLFLAIFKVMHGRFYKKADRMSKKSMISDRM